MSTNATTRTRRTAKNVTKKGDETPAVERPGNLKSLADWKKVPHESLRLQCEANRLPSKGNKTDLAVRLFQFFHPDGVKNRRKARAAQKNGAQGDSNGRDDVDAILHEPPPEIIRAEDDLPDDNNTQQEETFPYGEDPAGVHTDNNKRKRTRSPTASPQSSPKKADNIDLNDVIQRAVASAVASALKPVLEEMSVQKEKQADAELENQALRSQLKSKIDFSINDGDPTNLSPISPSGSGSKSAVNTTANPITMTDGANGTAAGLLSSHPPAPRLPTTKNPFTLPGLMKKELQAIEDGEYIDFDKLKPKKLDQDKRDDEEGFGIAMASYYDDELGAETLRLKKVSTNKVQTFPEWLECWNKFLSARLHYHPKEHALLMAYQRLITIYAKKYRFAAVYAYDQAFRKRIAAERSHIPEHMTVFWNKQNDELMNEHLTVDRFIPEKTCFKCNQKGHMANNCSNKKFSGQNKNRQNSGSSQNRYQAPPPPGPPPQPPQPFPAFQFQSPYHPFYFQPGSVGPPVNSHFNPSGGTNAATGAQTVRGKGKFCNTYNHKGSCWRGQTCHFNHACNRCGRTDHGGINCKDFTSTGFSPAAGYIPRF